MEIKWLSFAYADLDLIESYIAKNNPDQSVKIVLQIIKSVDILTDQPSVGRPGRVNGTRELVVRNLPFIIPYRKNGQYIEILRVFHQSRKWPSKFEEQQ